MNLQQAKTALVHEITGLEPGWKITVEYWSVRGIGPRIAEISGSKELPGGGLSGWSYMQSDADSQAVIFAAERYVLAQQYFPEDVPEALWQLTHAIKKGEDS